MGVEVSAFAITDAVVEEAAIRAWDAPDCRGGTSHAGTWAQQTEGQRIEDMRSARVVLEYAASLGGVAPAPAPSRVYVASDDTKVTSPLLHMCSNGSLT